MFFYGKSKMVFGAQWASESERERKILPFKNIESLYYFFFFVWYEDHACRFARMQRPFVCIQMTVILFLFVVVSVAWMGFF